MSVASFNSCKNIVVLSVHRKRPGVDRACFVIYLQNNCAYNELSIKLWDILFLFFFASLVPTFSLILFFQAQNIQRLDYRLKKGNKKSSAQIQRNCSLVLNISIGVCLFNWLSTCVIISSTLLCLWTSVGDKIKELNC